MYSERYVAFADILGFSEIVRMSARPGSLQQDALLNALLEARMFHPGLNKGDDVQFQTFSDSIVISSAATPPGLLHIFYSLIDLSVNLLAQGLLVRGAVAKGDLCHENSIMFGPAFLEAYRIECNIAKYPRIVLSRDVHQDFQRIELGIQFPKVRLADDGPPFVHIFGGLELLNRGEPTIEFLNSEEVLNAQKCQRALQNLLNASMYEPRHYEKLRWLAVYWNSTVAADAGRALEPIALHPH